METRVEAMVVAVREAAIKVAEARAVGVILVTASKVAAAAGPGVEIAADTWVAQVGRMVVEAVEEGMEVLTEAALTAATVVVAVMLAMAAMAAAAEGWVVVRKDQTTAVPVLREG